MKIDFSKPALQKLAPEAQAYMVWDAGYPYDGNLGARVAPSGAVSIFIQYRVPGGKQSKKTLYRLQAFLHANLSISALRKEARDFVLAAQDAGLTTSEQAQAQAREQAAGQVAVTTIAELGELWLAKKADPSLGGGFEQYADEGRAARLAIKRAAEVWGDTPLAALRSEHASKLIKFVMSQGKDRSGTNNEAALKTVRLLVPMLRYARENLDIDVRLNIFSTVTVRPNKPSPKVLKDEDRDAFLAAIDTWAAERRSAERLDAADCVRFIYSTACRGSEAFRAQWGEIDLDKRTWLRPEAKRKTRRVMGSLAGHVQKLTSEEIEILERIKARHRAEGRSCGADDYVFPNRGNTQGGAVKPHRTGVSGALKAIAKLAGIDYPLSTHSLRASRVSFWRYDKVVTVGGVDRLGIDWDRIARHIGSSASILQSVYGRETQSEASVEQMFE